MSFEWIKEHCPKTHHPKGVQPKNIVGRQYWCPLHADFVGKCFYHCNLDAEQLCGDCVHWYGDCTAEEPIGYSKYNSNGRHDRFGQCPYQITSVGAEWHNDCPHYFKRPKDFDWAFPDWVEHQVEQSDIDAASLQARPLRIRAREQWFEMWGDKTPRLG